MASAPAKALRDVTEGSHSPRFFPGTNRSRRWQRVFHACPRAFYQLTARPPALFGLCGTAELRPIRFWDVHAATGAVAPRQVATLRSQVLRDATLVFLFSSPEAGGLAAPPWLSVGPVTNCFMKMNGERWRAAWGKYV